MCCRPRSHRELAAHLAMHLSETGAHLLPELPLVLPEFALALLQGVQR